MWAVATVVQASGQRSGNGSNVSRLVCTQWRLRQILMDVSTWALASNCCKLEQLKCGWMTSWRKCDAADAGAQRQSSAPACQRKRAANPISSFHSSCFEDGFEDIPASGWGSARAMAPTTLAAACKHDTCVRANAVGYHGSRPSSKVPTASRRWGGRPACLVRAAPASNSSAVGSPELLSEAEKFMLELSGEELAAAAAAPDTQPAELEAQVANLRSQVSVSPSSAMSLF